jgi:glycosyltransferase involved in cell wall biosynthesis
VTNTIAIIMPAYRAEQTILPAVQSVLGQSFGDWQLLLISDDGVDYEALLGRAGLTDPRFRFLSSGSARGNASAARNVGLDAIDAPYAAILDADDRFKPDKLARCAAALETHAIVSTALDVMREDFSHLRYVGRGEDRLLAAGAHKWVNFSMDSMIAWDRRRTDARYDPALPNMTDLDFLMQLYRAVPASFHIGAPLHDYVKRPLSMSNGPGVTERMIGVKRLLLRRLAEGDYPMADPDAEAGISAFLEVSVQAEATYPDALARTPGLLFEDHLEPLLHAGAALDP